MISELIIQFLIKILIINYMIIYTNIKLLIMDYNITVGKHHIYMTYNHCEIFKKYNIYPRDFNDKQVIDIIPFYEEEIHELEKIYHEVVNYRELNPSYNWIIDYKYQHEYMYSNNKSDVLQILYSVMEILNDCNSFDIWQSD